MNRPFRTPYGDFDVLAKWASPDWDDQTREAVAKRLFEVPDVRFFTEAEARTLAAVVDRIVPQPERGEAEKIPVVPWIDEKLHEDRRDGYRFADVPPQREAWRRGLAGIDDTARALFGEAFAELDGAAQDEVLRRIEAGDPPGETWTALPAERFFKSVLLLTIVETYYAHPTAWNEVGYNGPSSPRGHMRIWLGGVDPWEAHEAPSGPARKD